MMNNDTIVTATLFGVTAGITTQSMSAIIIGAIAVGVVQPFFRVLWTNKLNQEIRKNKCPSCKRKKRKK
ncbi:hypothetical protein [Planktomarina sp.]|uniref:hypothetical protein n=1 Tax=Planktomarina sp. TaxID=2024851 RepID=UPI003260A4E4